MNNREMYISIINDVSNRFDLSSDEASGLCALALNKIFYPESVEERKISLLKNAREEFQEAIFEFEKLAFIFNERNAISK